MSVFRRLVHSFSSSVQGLISPRASSHNRYGDDEDVMVQEFPGTEGIHASGPIVNIFYDATEGRVVVVCRTDVEQFDVDSGERALVHVVPRGDRIESALCSADHDRIVLGKRSGQILVLDVCTESSGRLIRTFPHADRSESLAGCAYTPLPEQGHTGVVSALAWWGKDKIISGGADGTVRTWSLISGEEIRVLHAVGSFPTPAESVGVPADPHSVHPRPPASVSTICFSPKRVLAIVGDVGGCLRSVDMEAGVVGWIVCGHRGTVVSSIVAEESDSVVTSGTDGTLAVFNTATGMELVRYNFVVTCSAYDPHRDLLFTGSADGSFHRWMVKRDYIHGGVTMLQDLHVQTRQGELTCIMFESHGDILTTGAVNGSFRLLHAATGISHADPMTMGRWSSYEKELDGETVEQSISFLQQELGPPPSVRALPKLQNEEKLARVFLGVLEEHGPARGTYEGAFVQALQNQWITLEEKVNTAYTDLQRSKDLLLMRCKGVLDLGIGDEEIDARYRRRLEAMRKRHEAELVRLQMEAQEEKRILRATHPMARLRVAGEAKVLQDSFEERVERLEDDGSRDVRRHLVNLYPQTTLLKDRYFIGPPINKHTKAPSLFSGMDIATAERVAIKRLLCNVPVEHHLRHKTLVPLVDVCSTDNHTFIVMGWMKETLGTYLQRRPDTTISMGEVAEIVFQLLSCVDYLHTNGMIHRDIRPSTVFLDGNGQILLEHFGVMRALDGDEVQEESWCFASPEVLMRIACPSSDIWSIGVLFALLLMPRHERKPIFTGKTNLELLSRMIQVVGRPPIVALERIGEESQMPEEGEELLRAICHLPFNEAVIQHPLTLFVGMAPPEAQDLLNHLLAFSPDERISPTEAFHHPFFVKYRPGKRPTIHDVEEATASLVVAC